MGCVVIGLRQREEEGGEEEHQGWRAAGGVGVGVGAGAGAAAGAAAGAGAAGGEIRRQCRNKRRLVAVLCRVLEWNLSSAAVKGSKRQQKAAKGSKRQRKAAKGGNRHALRGAPGECTR